jgi:exodeoxyribonuclease V gamma subunit
MGYALPGNAERLFGGILPCDNIEGMETQALGRLLEYLYGLFAMTKLLEQPGKPREWTNALSSLLDQFFKCKETAQGDLQALRQIIQRLSSLSERSGFDAPLHIDIIKAFLHRHAEQRTAGAGFMSGGVTCCEMLPMRSIPFKVICLLGLNHDAYPRPARKLGFDLMARHPRAGDRSRRRDDRYLFLEALLSARQALIISYCGQSIADNAPLPPSVLVSELLDVIEQGFRTQEGTATARLTTHHRLQAFHSTYFCTESSRLSYSEENLHAAIRLQERRDQPHFIQDPLPGPGQEWKTVDIGELVRFYQNPSRFWIEKRLLTTIPESGDMPADTEAFDLRGLDRYGLEQDLLAGVLAGRRLEELFAVYRAAGRLPHGNVGAGHCKALTRDIETFAARIRPYFQEKPSEFFDVCLDISGFRLTGHIEPYGPDGLFQYRFTDLKAKDHLRMWIQHLVLLSAARQPVTSKLAGRDEMWIYAPAQDVEVLLEGLLSIYWNGLSMPIHFFPDSSFEFASQALLKGKPVADAIRSARRIWYGSEYNRGESEDRYYRRCFENREALDEEFQRLSLIVCEPIFKFRKHL